MTAIVLLTILCGILRPALAYTSANPQALSKLQDCQETAGPIASSFQPAEFRPVPWLSNRHIQTVGGVFWRDIPECSNVVDIGTTLTALRERILRSNDYPQEKYWDRRERIETPDGDWFHVDHKDCPGECKGLMILIHGLESNSESPLSIDMAKAYSALGLEVSCINFRGCSGEPNDTIGFYHLGFTDDLLLYLKLVKAENRPIYVSGFSLGGNMVLKALGELKEEAVDVYDIRGAAIFCAPLNDSGYKSLMAPGISRILYTKGLLKSLQQKAQMKFEQFCDGNPDTDKFDYRSCMEAETIYDFENAFIASVYGFDDTVDYYRKTSCINFLEDVAVPTLVLNGEDDPFLDGSCQPTKITYEEGGRAPVKMIHSKQGGHCGFIFHQVTTGDEPIPSNSWGPAEMARFISHVMASSST